MQTTGSNFEIRSHSSTMTDMTKYNKNVSYDMNVSNTGTAVTFAVVASVLS